MTKLLTITVGPKCREYHGDENAVAEAMERIAKTLKVQMLRHPDRSWNLVLEQVPTAGTLTTFLINGESRTTNVGEVVTYEEICRLAEHDPAMFPTVVIEPLEKEGRTLTPGQSFTVEGGERIAIAYTGAS